MSIAFSLPSRRAPLSSLYDEQRRRGVTHTLVNRRLRQLLARGVPKSKARPNPAMSVRARGQGRQQFRRRASATGARYQLSTPKENPAEAGFFKPTKVLFSSTC